MVSSCNSRLLSNIGHIQSTAFCICNTKSCMQHGVDADLDFLVAIFAIRRELKRKLPITLGPVTATLFHSFTHTEQHTALDLNPLIFCRLRVHFVSFQSPNRIAHTVIAAIIRVSVVIIASETICLVQLDLCSLQHWQAVSRHGANQYNSR